MRNRSQGGSDPPRGSAARRRRHLVRVGLQRPLDRSRKRRSLDAHPRRSHAVAVRPARGGALLEVGVEEREAVVEQPLRERPLASRIIVGHLAERERHGPTRDASSRGGARSGRAMSTSSRA
jgi:hypothetical protein